jgi:hypothetical protein
MAYEWRPKRECRQFGIDESVASRPTQSACWLLTILTILKIQYATRSRPLDWRVYSVTDTTKSLGLLRILKIFKILQPTPKSAPPAVSHFADRLALNAGWDERACGGYPTQKSQDTQN